MIQQKRFFKGAKESEKKRLREIRIIDEQVYIEPISSCNLKCKLCYSNVLNGKETRILEKGIILDFINKLKILKSQFSIYWCGTGEVFLYKDFPGLINEINEKHGSSISHDIMTNGTIDILDRFNSLENISFYVSIDGQKRFHENNRGNGTYRKTINFCKKALSLKCKSLEIRSLVTKENVESLDSFESEIHQALGEDAKISLNIPYTSSDVFSTKSDVLRKERFDDSLLLPKKEMKLRIEELYGSRYHDSIELSLPVNTYLSLTYGGVFNCCEGIQKIGEPTEDMRILVKKLKDSSLKCYNCSLFEKC